MSLAESAGFHFGTLGGGVFFEGENKMGARYFKVKYDFLTIEARNKCNTSFTCDFDRNISAYCIMFMTQGHLQGQKVTFKVK